MAMEDELFILSSERWLTFCEPSTSLLTESSLTQPLFCYVFLNLVCSSTSSHRPSLDLPSLSNLRLNGSTVTNVAWGLVAIFGAWTKTSPLFTTLQFSSFLLVHPPLSKNDGSYIAFIQQQTYEPKENLQLYSLQS